VDRRESIERTISGPKGRGPRATMAKAELVVSSFLFEKPGAGTHVGGRSSAPRRKNRKAGSSLG